MAIIKDNIMMEGVSGMLGDVVVFRQLRGKTIMANRPHKPRFQSELQRENRVRFRRAAAFAKQAMQDPEKKQYYLARARKLKLPNAYTAAITDYMRKPAVTAVKYQGTAHDRVTITAGKAGFALSSVTVSLVNTEGTLFAASGAMQRDKHKSEWTAWLSPNVRAQHEAVNPEDIFRLMITITDRTGQTHPSSFSAAQLTPASHTHAHLLHTVDVSS